MPQFKDQLRKFMTLKRSIGVALLIGLTAPVMVSQAAAQEAAGDVVSFAEIAPIIATRCAVCHSATPTQRGYRTPPNGVAFDTPEQIKAKARPIEVWAILTEVMPLNNETDMTDDERALLAAWLAAGADISN